MMRSAATEVYPRVSWRNHGPFCSALAGGILPTCPGLSENLCPPRPSSLKRCWAILGRSAAGRRSMLSTWTVTDDWPERVPITEAEVEVFERWFADLFDELFGADR